MKEAVKFLRHIYDASVGDVANILTAEADHNIDVILSYLEHVKEYTEGLIEKVNQL